MSAFNEFVEFVAKIIAQPLSKKNTTLSGITLHKSPEVKMVTKNIEWHKANATYTSSYIIGAIIVTVGILTLAGICNAAAEYANCILARKAKA